MQIKDLEERLERAREVLDKIAKGNLNVSIEVEDFTDPLAPLEIGINFLINDLRETFESNQVKTRLLLEQRRDLESKLETIERQGKLIRMLSTPIMEVWSGVLVLTIVGEVDAVRAADIMSSLLARIHQTHKEWVIIDVTGMEGMDAGTAGYLTEMTKAVSLLGTRAVLTGIQPGVAQALVESGSDFGELIIRKDLKDGLELCLSRMDLRSAKGSRAKR